MEIKKTRKASLENKKKSIFLFGLLTSLGLLLMAFEWSNYDVNYTLPTMEVGVLIEHEPVLENLEIIRPKPVKKQHVTQKTIIDEYEKKEIEEDTTQLLVITDPIVDPVIGIDTAPLFIDPPKIISLPPVDYAEKMPEYPGGDAEMFKDLAKNLSKNNVGVSGKVFVEFVVEMDGSISSAKIKRGIHDIIDKDALKAVLKLKKWEPGEQNHKPVRVRLVLPINYVVR